MDINLNADRVRVLARLAYTFAYPLVANYGTMYLEAIGNRGSSRHGGFGSWVRYNGAPYSGDVQCSSTWIDLRSEPWLLGQAGPAFRAGLQVRSIDLWGFELVREILAGRSNDTSILFVAPTWTGDVPDGIGVIARGESSLVRLVAFMPSNGGQSRAAGTSSLAPARPLSKHLGIPATPTTANPSWLPWKQGTETSDEFWPCANHALSLTVPHSHDQKILEAIAEIGVVSGGSWDAESIPSDIRNAIGDGMSDALSRMMRAARRQQRPVTSRGIGAETDIIGRTLGVLLETLPAAADFEYASWPARQAR